MTWRQPPSGTWGETEKPQAHWNWDEHQTQETTPKPESWTWVRTKLVSRNRHLNLESHVHAVTDATAVSRDCTQNNSDATVRPVTLPEGWTVVVNSLRQVVYCHVKSGIACFQMPENPELLNDLEFENGQAPLLAIRARNVDQIASAKLAIIWSTTSRRLAVVTILSAVRTMLKIRSWSKHRLVGSIPFKPDSTNDAQRKSQEQRNHCHEMSSN